MMKQLEFVGVLRNTRTGDYMKFFLGIVSRQQDAAKTKNKLGMTAFVLTMAALACCRKTLADDTVRRFVESNCFDCHSGDDAEAGLDLKALQLDPADKKNRERWIQVHDRVAADEMPPSDYAELDAAKRTSFLTTLAATLIEAVRSQQAANGRGVLRRLNRVEYETALSDLLGLPLAIQERLPTDAKKDGFDTVGAALNVSSVQVEAYLQTLDAVLDEATVLYEKPVRRSWKFDYRDTSGIMEEYRRTGPFHILPDGVVFFAPEKHAHLHAVLDHFTIPYSAKYCVKVTAYAIRSDEPITLTIRTGGPGHGESDEVPKTLLGHVTTREGEPQVFEFEPRLVRGQFFRIYPASLPYMRFIDQIKEQQKDYRGPGVVVQSVEVDGPIFDQWPPKSHQQLWGGVKTQPLADAKRNNDPNGHLNGPPSRTAMPRMTRISKDQFDKKTGNQWVYDPRQEAGGERIYPRARIPNPLHSTMQFIPDNPKSEATRLLTQFVPLAYRRPATETEIQRFIDLVQQWLDDGDDFETAMRAGYKAILTSPGFLYHQASLPVTVVDLAKDPSRTGSLARSTTKNAPAIDPAFLSDHALAERLSFFLWDSIPDDELLGLAETGKLSDPATLREQAERMLRDSKSDRFIEDFLGQWLELRQLEFTSPDSDLYPEHDPVLQWSLAQETQRFFRELLDNNLSVANVIDSDFAMLNSRLAQHYDIAGVDDMTFRKVRLPEDSVRGGVLTQASVLKVTANGTTTSPVVRGAWVLDRIIGKPANPPPPGTPAIEPDIRGATTVRQQLEQHRNVESCATCHVKIDPPGVALESFDVIGGWRDRYRALDPKKADIKPKFLPNQDVPIKYTLALPVDASDKLADGRRFDDIRGFKEMLLSDPDQIARTVASKLIIYSTGASISFADRVEIEKIFERTKASKHGLRSLIREIVQSELFRTR